MYLFHLGVKGWTEVDWKLSCQLKVGLGPGSSKPDQADPGCMNHLDFWSSIATFTSCNEKELRTFVSFSTVQCRYFGEDPSLIQKQIEQKRTGPKGSGKGHKKKIAGISNGSVSSSNSIGAPGSYPPRRQIIIMIVRTLGGAKQVYMYRRILFRPMIVFQALLIPNRSPRPPDR